MSFVQKNLASNETIIYQTKLHWWVFAPGIIFLLLGALTIKSFGGVFIIIALISLGLAYLIAP